MAPMLTVQNAEIKTAAVELKTLTVSGKQVTLAVFRQLPEERLINDVRDFDLTLNGDPWGWVNYHPDNCRNGYAPHRHVIWQRGSQLLRAHIDKQPILTGTDLQIFTRMAQFVLDSPPGIRATERLHAAARRMHAHYAELEVPMPPDQIDDLLLRAAEAAGIPAGDARLALKDARRNPRQLTEFRYQLLADLPQLFIAV